MAFQLWGQNDLQFLQMDKDACDLTRRSMDISTRMWAVDCQRVIVCQWAEQSTRWLGVKKKTPTTISESQVQTLNQQSHADQLREAADNTMSKWQMTQTDPLTYLKGHQVRMELTHCALAFQTVEQAFRQIQNIVDFSSNIMSCLLGEKFVHSGVSAHTVFFPFIWFNFCNLSCLYIL